MKLSPKLDESGQQINLKFSVKISIKVKVKINQSNSIENQLEEEGDQKLNQIKCQMNQSKYQSPSVVIGYSQDEMNNGCLYIE